MQEEPTRPKRARSTLTPEQRTLRARKAAYARAAQGKVDTAPATAASMARFEREVDPEGVLSSAERAKRAEGARKAYMVGLQLKSSRARQARKAKPASG